jgi:hypothetical protein
LDKIHVINPTDETSSPVLRSAASFREEERTGERERETEREREKEREGKRKRDDDAHPENQPAKNYTRGVGHRSDERVLGDHDVGRAKHGRRSVRTTRLRDKRKRSEFYRHRGIVPGAVELAFVGGGKHGENYR